MTVYLGLHKRSADHRQNMAILMLKTSSEISRNMHEQLKLIIYIFNSKLSSNISSQTRKLNSGHS